mmetsp:Transcript_16216/g.50852  ORF Transcript_16216/g.50852 Transcript_16216/m.50852 type:complete len:272 (+) Transcript_16216:1397-2212(+)
MKRVRMLHEPKQYKRRKTPLDQGVADEDDGGKERDVLCNRLVNSSRVGVMVPLGMPRGRATANLRRKADAIAKKRSSDDPHFWATILQGFMCRGRKRKRCGFSRNRADSRAAQSHDADKEGRKRKESEDARKEVLAKWRDEKLERLKEKIRLGSTRRTAKMERISRRRSTVPSLRPRFVVSVCKPGSCTSISASSTPRTSPSSRAGPTSSRSRSKRLRTRCLTRISLVALCSNGLATSHGTMAILRRTSAALTNGRHQFCTSSTTRTCCKR